MRRALHIALMVFVISVTTIEISAAKETIVPNLHKDNVPTKIDASGNHGDCAAQAIENPTIVAGFKDPIMLLAEGPCFKGECGEHDCPKGTRQLCREDEQGYCEVRTCVQDDGCE